MSPGRPSHVLYLHGFRSSPESFKARRLRAWLHEHHPDVQWCAPALPPSPAAALHGLSEHTQDWPDEGSVVLGSSLGGFYATAWAVRQNWPCVVINPAVAPARDLAGYVGTLPYFHDPSQTFDFKAEYLDELRAIDAQVAGRCGRTLAVIAQGDELLDWREMQARYAGAHTHVVPGSDHGLSDFEDHLPVILNFLRLNP